MPPTSIVLRCALAKRILLVGRRKHLRLKERHRLATAVHFALAALDAKRLRATRLALIAFAKLIRHAKLSLQLHRLVAAREFALAAARDDYFAAAFAARIPFARLVSHS